VTISQHILQIDFENPSNTAASFKIFDSPYPIPVWIRPPSLCKKWVEFGRGTFPELFE
jgi:hypothetical protein